MQNRREFLGTAGLAALAARAGYGQAGQPRRPATARPNVLVIVTDQQSNGAVSAAGNPWLRTPAMDSIAAAGVSFSESYCVFPLCSPSRSAFLTSRMVHETGVRNNGIGIAAGIPTLHDVFSKAGYRTAWSGKWHLPGDQVIGFEQLSHKVANKNSQDAAPGAMNDPPVAGACAEFISKQKDPFLLVASFINPHDICQWIRAHRGSRPSYPELSTYPPAPGNMGVDPDEPEYIQYYRTGKDNLGSEAVMIASEWNREDVRFYLHSYYRLVEDADRQVGRVLQALRKSGQYENTLILFTADHGEGMAGHRWAQKLGFYEEPLKVPFIVAGPGISRRGVRDTRTLVSGVDLVPTLCDCAGVTPPALMRGRSLRPAIEGGTIDRRFVVSELCEYGEKERQGRMLRTPRYKYVVFNGGKRPEQLFDLEFDPGEEVDLAARPSSAGILQEHRDLLARWIAETNDDFRLPA
jgi:arylsulfatase A-like enzyme